MPLRVTSINPQHESSAELGTDIVITFSEPLNQLTFTERMASIVYNGQKIPFTYSINGSSLILKPQQKEPGIYEITVYGYDPIIKQYLKSTSGSVFTGIETYKITYTQPQGGGGTTVPTNTGETVPVVLMIGKKDISFTYNKIVNTDVLVITCSEKITANFTATITLDVFGSEPAVFDVNVTTSGNYQYQDNTITLRFDQLQPNTMIYFYAPDVKFENKEQQIDLVQVTNLKPYVNLSKMHSEIKQLISDADIIDQYYQQLYQIFRIESITGRQILGSSLSQHERMLIERLQVIEVARQQLNKLNGISELSVDVGQQKISYGTGNYINESYGRLIENTIREFVSVSPTSQQPLPEFKTSGHTWRINQVNAYERFRAHRQIDTTNPFVWTDVL